MSGDDVRKVLLEEVKLLAPLIDTVRNHKGSTSGVASEIKKSWGDFLRMRQKNNESLLGLSNAKLIQALDAETDQLKDYRKCKKIGSSLPKSWDVFLKCELDFLGKLKTLYKNR